MNYIDVRLYAALRSGEIKVNSKTLPVYRFWKRVDIEGPVHPVHGQCWLWTGDRLKNGYGRLSAPRGIESLAHRLAWDLLVGPIPKDLCVLHKCDLPACVNPGHLFLGTNKDNTQDMYAKGRGVLGETCVQSVLTEDDVRAIRARYRRYSHKDGCGAMAKEYGVGIVEIWRVVQGQRWGHVT